MMTSTQHFERKQPFLDTIKERADRKEVHSSRHRGFRMQKCSSYTMTCSIGLVVCVKSEHRKDQATRWPAVLVYSPSQETYHCGGNCNNGEVLKNYLEGGES